MLQTSSVSVSVSVSVSFFLTSSFQIRIVPWRCWEEWVDVYKLLYSGEKESIRKGINMVKAWRCRGGVPFAVDSTANLLEILIFEGEMGEDANSSSSSLGGGSLPESVKKMMFGMALARFVNNVVDVYQKGKTAIRIGSIADKVGLPSSLVTIRHDVTHNILPSLTVLRDAACESQEWLRNNYWEKQLASLDQQEPQIVSDLVSIYVNLRSSSLSALESDCAASKKRKEEKKWKEREEDILQRVSSHISVYGVGSILTPCILDALFPERSRLGVFNSKSVRRWISDWDNFSSLSSLKPQSKTDYQDFLPAPKLWPLLRPAIEYFSRQWGFFSSFLLSKLCNFLAFIFSESEGIGKTRSRGEMRVVNDVWEIIWALLSDDEINKIPLGCHCLNSMIHPSKQEETQKKTGAEECVVCALLSLCIRCPVPLAKKVVRSLLSSGGLKRSKEFVDHTEGMFSVFSDFRKLLFEKENFQEKKKDQKEEEGEFWVLSRKKSGRKYFEASPEASLDEIREFLKTKKTEVGGDLETTLREKNLASSSVDIEEDQTWFFRSLGFSSPISESAKASPVLDLSLPDNYDGLYHRTLSQPSSWTLSESRSDEPARRTATPPPSTTKTRSTKKIERKRKKLPMGKGEPQKKRAKNAPQEEAFDIEGVASQLQLLV